jgi:hypothetical protein
VAAETRAIDAVAKQATGSPPIDKPVPPPAAPFKRGLRGWEIQAAFGVSFGTTNPLKMSDDGTVAGKSFLAGVDRRYMLTPNVQLRPEIAIRYQSASFDTDMIESAETIDRAGISIGIPVVLVLGGETARFELVVGPALLVTPYNHAEGDGSMLNIDKFNFIDPGVMAGLAVAFGKFAIQLDYRRGLVGVADNFDTSLQTLSLGLAVRVSD